MQISRTTVSHKIEDTLWQALHLHTCELLKNGSLAEKRVAKRFAQITCSATKVSCRPRPKAFKKKLFQGVEWRGGWHTAHYTRSPKMDDASIVAVLKDLAGEFFVEPPRKASAREPRHLQGTRLPPCPEPAQDEVASLRCVASTSGCNDAASALGQPESAPTSARSATSGQRRLGSHWRRQ